MAFGRGGFGGGRGGMGGGPKPVKVGEEVEVTIEAVASKGDGIAKKEGFVIFVPGAAVGEKIMIKITDVRGRYAMGEKAGTGSSAAPEATEAPAEAEATEAPAEEEQPAQ
ncbi:MAG: TRAM domain-containing protein [Candidatus Micrarchaeota archaeon]